MVDTKEEAAKKAAEEAKKNSKDSIATEGDKVLQEIRKAKEELKEENDRKELLQAQDAMGGDSDAGQTEEPKKEETAEEFTTRFENGEVNLAGETRGEAKSE